MAAPAVGAVGKFLGNTVSEAGAFAAGLAISPVLRPVVQALENEAWKTDPNRPIDVGTLAQGVAEGHVTMASALTEAALTGTSAARFAELVTIARTGPGTGAALELWRRALITDAEVATALERGGLEQEWIDAIVGTKANGYGLKTHPLDPAQIALAIVRGNMHADGLLPVAPSNAVGLVPADPISPIDPLVEASWSGVDFERLAVMARSIGLPAATVQMLDMLNRGIIEDADFYRGISEGDIRNEWGPFLYKLRDAVLTSNDYVAARLRAWIDDAALYAGGALTGHSSDQMDLLLKIHGRPLSWHQVWIGLQRGGTYDGPLDVIDPAFLKALEESDIRPEWYNLAWAQRYSYPSAFVVKALATAGDLTQAEVLQILTYEGWEPVLAGKVSKIWAGAKPSTATPITKRFVTSATTALSKRYIDAAVTQADAAAQLAELGVSASDQAALFKVWDIAREIELAGLTPAEIKHAYSRNVITEADALTRLEALRYSAADAKTYLGLP